MNRNRIVLIVTLLLGMLKLSAQIGINNPKPHPLSTLDLDNPNSDSETLMLPKAKIGTIKTMVFNTDTVTKFEDAGLMFYNPSDKGIYFYNGVTWQMMNPIRTNVNTSSAVVDVKEEEYTLDGSLDISGTLKLSDNGTADQKEGFVAINENGGEVKWKKLESLQTITEINNTLNSKNYVSSRHLVDDDIPNSQGVIREFSGNQALVNGSGASATLSQEAYGRTLDGYPLESFRVRNALFGDGFNRIELPNDGIQRMMQITARSRWIHGTSSGSAGFKMYYIPISGVEKMLGSDERRLGNFDRSLYTSLGIVCSFLHQGNGGYIEPTLKTTGVTGGMTIDEISTDVIGFVTNNIITD